MATKSTIWNQLKQVGFDSKQLKERWQLSYQSATQNQLQMILDEVQGVNENLGMVSSEVTGNENNETISFDRCDTYIKILNIWYQSQSAQYHIGQQLILRKLDYLKQFIWRKSNV